MSLEPDRSNTKEVLVITDHFTKYAVALPTPNQRARTVAKYLWDHFIVHYGFPERLLSDQGPDFESHTIRELCELAGIKKVHTTPYHPRGNPVERFNRTLLQMLGTLNQPDKLHWKDFVKLLVHAYNCTKNDTTGFSPYELMFGRQPRLPIDLAFGLPTNTNKLSHSQYVSDLKYRLEQSYKIANSTAQKNADRNKIRFDRRVVDSTLEVGDWILVRNVKLRGKNKLADKWEEDVYIVLKKAGDMPVYTVKPECKSGPVRTLHRDLLLPCGFLPATKMDKPVGQLPVRRPRTRNCPTTESVEEEGEDSDSENEPTLRFSAFDASEPNIFVTVHDTHEMRDPPCMIRQTKESDVTVSTLSDCPVHEVPTELRDELTIPNLPALDNQPKQVHELDQTDSNLPDVPCLIEDSCSPEDVCLLERENSPENVDDIQDEQCTVCSVSDTKDDMVVVEREEPEEGRMDKSNELEIDRKEDTERPTGMDTSIRRSERMRQPPKRLDYAELGNPLVTVVKSFFHGLTTALADALNEEDDFSHPYVLPT